MKWATAGYMVLLALVTVPTTIVYSTPQAIARTLARSPQGRGLSAAQVHQAASADATVALIVTVGLGVVYLVIAAGSVRGWTWAFWIALVLLAIEALTSLTALNSMVQSAPSPQPEASLLANLAVAVLAIPMVVWLGVGRARHGAAWAMKAGPARIPSPWGGGRG
ncbi:MAG: hypothetical protein ACREPI_06675 [Candidatus Dormibacterales bacterium]